MNSFELIFGVTPQNIQKNCILTPFLTKNLLKTFGVSKLHKGHLYQCAQGNQATLIHTGIGAPFVGDAVLYLKETSCQNIFFLGSCGIVKPTKTLNIGSLVSPTSALAAESFTQILNQDFSSVVKSFANTELFQNFHQQKFSKAVKQAVCASFGSLRLECDNLPFLECNHVEVVDLETAAFFCAATQIKKRALALLYVTDSIKEKPFYINRSDSDKTNINKAIQNAIQIISDYLIMADQVIG